MKDEKPITTVDEALHNAKDQGADFVNAEEYVEGEVPVADTPIFAEAANQEVPVEEVPVEEVPVEAPVEETPTFSTDYTAFDEASEFAQPVEKKSNVVPIIGIFVAFVFLLGICFFAISSKDGSIKSFLRIETPDKEESKKVEDNTPMSNDVEQLEEEAPVEEPQTDDSPAESPKEDSSKPDKESGGSSNSGSSSNSNSGSDDNYGFDINTGNNGISGNSGNGGTSNLSEEEYIRQHADVIHYNYLQMAPNSTFRHKEFTTRADFGKWLAIAMNLPINSKEPSVFNDMDGYSEYIPYINALQRAGITAGTVDGGYSPGAQIDRFSAVAMSVEAYNKLFPGDKGSCSKLTFTDVTPDQQKILDQASAFCITTGVGSTAKFNPSGNLYRRDATIMINKAVKRDHDSNLKCVYDEDMVFQDVPKEGKYYSGAVYEAATTHYCIKK